MAMWPAFSPAWATTSPPPTSRVSLAAPTRDIADAVRAEGRCLITFDLDFSDPRKFSPSQFAGIVVLRLHVPTSRLQVESITRFLAAKPQLMGKLWIVEETRARDWTP